MRTPRRVSAEPPATRMPTSPASGADRGEGGSTGSTLISARRWREDTVAPKVATSNPRSTRPPCWRPSVDHGCLELRDLAARRAASGRLRGVHGRCRRIRSRRCATGTRGRRATCPGGGRRSRRGRSWSARSCCSRRRWRGCSRRTRSGSSGGPTPAALAAASPGDAVREWGRLGYPRRALRLHASAVACVERHGGAGAAHARGAARAAGSRQLHGGCRGGVRVRDAGRRGRHQCPPGRRAVAARAARRARRCRTRTSPSCCRTSRRSR